MEPDNSGVLTREQLEQMIGTIEKSYAGYRHDSRAYDAYLLPDRMKDYAIIDLGTTNKTSIDTISPLGVNIVKNPWEAFSNQYSQSGIPTMFFDTFSPYENSTSYADTVSTVNELMNRILDIKDDYDEIKQEFNF